MPYDPSQNPRGLPSELLIEDPEPRITELSVQLADIEAQLEVFRLAGWDVLEHDLYDEIRRDTDGLVVRRRDWTMADVSFAQGRLAGIQYLLDLPERLRAAHARITEELAELQSPALSP